MGRLLKSIAIGLGCALCFSALADDRVEPNLLAKDRLEPSIFGENESRPVDDEQLAKVRGRLAAPTGLQQVGVVLWDEPRKGLPPARNASEAPGGSHVSTTATVFR